MLLQVRDEIIEADLSQHEGQLWVTEAGERRTAISWLIARVARLPLLADRVLSYVQEPTYFIAPSGSVLDQPDFQHDAAETKAKSAPSAILEVLGRRPPGTTSVVYLTSDAGEGKTTVINHLARQQAQRYKDKQTDWLLLPITLGGRGFLRFDDAVIAALVNRLRFQLLYFEGFLELVKLGVVVPAFDGFEEMFVESSSGEALSALGTLVRSLESSGSALIAARKAYFEYQSFRSQARLFDGMGGASVAFARISLDRWSKGTFEEYVSKRGLKNPEALYDAVSARFGTGHPLLTRAVLVKRLVDVAANADTLKALLDQLGKAPEDYFYQFVNAIVEREAVEKWIDRSGEPHLPLLSLEEHHELLAMIAHEMWLASTDVLKADVLDVVAELFADMKAKGPVLARQIRERLKHHSLLVNPDGSKSLYSFDHEDFRHFYLGEALGRQLLKGNASEVRRFLSVTNIPRSTAEAAVNYAIRQTRQLAEVTAFVADLGKTELPTSFAKENCGLLTILLLDKSPRPGILLEQLVFPPDMLRGRHLHAVTFRRCHFQPTSLAGARITNCVFDDCQFERIEIPADWHDAEAVIKGGRVASVVREAEDDQLFEPSQVAKALTAIGFAQAAEEQLELVRPPDDDVRLTERALRIFLRATQVNEHVFRQRLSGKANHFLDYVLPRLEDAGILIEVPYRGAGTQRRFRLSAPLQRIQEALASCDGTLAGFAEAVKHRETETPDE